VGENVSLLREYKSNYIQNIGREMDSKATTMKYQMEMRSMLFNNREKANIIVMRQIT
jgi:hypothetical protein